MEHKEYAYKMFNKDLTCTLGRGTFQYQPGVWYEELDKEANCRKNAWTVCPITTVLKRRSAGSLRLPGIWTKIRATRKCPCKRYAL